MRPFGLLTPLLIAGGLYVLFQAPSRDAESRTQCLREIDFVQQLSTSESDTRLNTLVAMRDFPFTCGSAATAFNGLMSVEEASTSLREVEGQVTDLVD